MGYFSELDLEIHEKYNEPWNRNLWLLEKIEELGAILESFNMYGEPELGVNEELYMYTDKDIPVEDIGKNNTPSVKDEGVQIAA